MQDQSVVIVLKGVHSIFTNWLIERLFNRTYINCNTERVSYDISTGQNIMSVQNV